jgi:hypothetical protein
MLCVRRRKLEASLCVCIRWSRIRFDTVIVRSTLKRQPRRCLLRNWLLCYPEVLMEVAVTSFHILAVQIMYCFKAGDRCMEAG